MVTRRWAGAEAGEGEKAATRKKSNRRDFMIGRGVTRHRTTEYVPE